MGKFKIGDKVVNKNNWNGKYEGYRIFKGYYTNRTGVYCTLSDLDISSVSVETGWTDKDLELYIEEEVEVSKTFKEVIRDIKEGEVWESYAKTIKLYKNGAIEIIEKGGRRQSCFSFNDSNKFNLRRLKVSFTEALESFKKGKEIESVYGKNKYRQSEMNMFVNEEYFESCRPCISMNELTEEWYINN